MPQNGRGPSGSSGVSVPRMGDDATIDPQVLRTRLSAERLATFEAAAPSAQEAVRLYEWNGRLSGALFERLADVEVVVRNALHQALRERHERLGRAGTWFDDPQGELTERARQDIAQARDSLNRLNRPHEQGRLVAELGFGFWAFLLSKRYKDNLWPWTLRFAFPHWQGSPNGLFEAMQSLRQLRNRVAHHEPVINRNVKQDDSFCDRILGAICPTTRTWSQQRSRVHTVLASRPC